MEQLNGGAVTGNKAKRVRKSKSIKAQTWTYFFLLAALSLFVLWLFQLVFFKSAYKSMKKQEVERLGAEVKVEAIHVPKNNGVVLQGITVRRPEEKVVPTIYMERFYEDYLEGRDMDDILEEFMEIYEEQETAQMPHFFSC